MPSALDWKPDPSQPDNVETASAGNTTYSVTAWHPRAAGQGSYTAHVGSLHLGTFPYTAQGRRAAFTACESYAQFVADSLRAQAALAHYGVGRESAA
jgi:hypothetical protein